MWQVTWLQGAIAWCWIGLAQMKHTSASSSSSASPSASGLACIGAAGVRLACVEEGSDSCRPEEAPLALLPPRPLLRFPPRFDPAPAAAPAPSPRPFPRPPLPPLPLPLGRDGLSAAGPVGAAAPVSAMVRRLGSFGVELEGSRLRVWRCTAACKIRLERRVERNS